MLDDTDAPPVPPAGEDGPPPPPKARSVLMDILERTRDETETETARLMQTMRAKEDAERQRAEEEAQRKASEARARIDEERRKREEALREYEERKHRVEAEAQQKAQLAQEIVTAAKAPPPKSKAPVAIGVAVALVAAGVLAFLLIPRGTPAVMTLDKPFEAARPGAVVSTPVPFGAKSMEQVTGAPNPEKVVAVMQPAPYMAPAPVVVKKGNGVPKQQNVINLTTGILGGKKVVK